MAVLQEALQETLRRRGLRLLPFLVREVEDARSSLRRWAILRLGDLGPAARDAVPALKLAREEESVRSDADEALRRILPRLREPCLDFRCG